MKNSSKRSGFSGLILFFSISLLTLLISSRPLWANNIQVGTVNLTDQNTTDNYIYIQFDISWDNSWRLDGVAEPYNWDAAWVFVKFNIEGDNPDLGWQHCSLNTSGHTAPSGSVVENPTSDNPQTGVFIYRSAGNKTTAGNAANVAWNNVKLRWNYGADGIADEATVDVKVFAIEMVYIPEGNFYVGSGGNEPSAFYQYPTSTNPYQITSEAEIPVGTTNGNLYYPPYLSDFGGDQKGPIPATFPKGYAAFYLMKYEISQGQWVDFLNTLTRTQQNFRTGSNVSTDQITNVYVMSNTSSISHRCNITCSGTGNGTTDPITFTASVPDRACNYLSWADGAAYSDWAGLRPMTELEFEKACRGTKNAVPEEYAWGNTLVASSAYTLSNDGQPNETVSNAAINPTGNTSYTPTDGSIDGPLRCGIFATSTSTRAEAGASYYGVMEMSGNLWERPVTIGHPDGRAFTGVHGNGAIPDSGNANVSNWPNTSGAGVRGGAWLYSAPALRVSDRNAANHLSPSRNSDDGFRSARTQQLKIENWRIED